MPSKTRKQARFMRMCASDKGRKKATKKCPHKKIAREFVKADKRKKR
jgi:hypothetical protein